MSTSLTRGVTLLRQLMSMVWWLVKRPKKGRMTLSWWRLHMMSLRKRELRLFGNLGDQNISFMILNMCSLKRMLISIAGVNLRGASHLTFQNMLSTTQPCEYLMKYIIAGYREISWDGQDQNGRIVASGVYLYRLKTGSIDLTRKLLFLR